MEESNEKVLQTKVDTLQSQIENLVQENKDIAQQFEWMSKELVDLKKTLSSCVDAINDHAKIIRTTDQKLQRAFQWWTQLNCRRCGKTLPSDHKQNQECLYCDEASPLS